MEPQKKTKINPPIFLRDTLQDKRIGLQSKKQPERKKRSEQKKQRERKKRPERNITLKRTPQGMEFSCPHYQEILWGILVIEGSDEKLSRGASIVSYLLWTVIIPVGFAVIGRISGGPTLEIHTIGAYLGILGLLWGVILYQFLQTDKIVLLPGKVSLQVRLCGITLRKADYMIDDITNVRPSWRHDTLEFDYRGQRITWGEGLERDVVTRLLQQFSLILSFQYHSVERIIFGDVQSLNLDPHTTVQNVDASALSFPFVHLQQILIQTATYDFHQVEQFLTYAVNVIGRDHLRKHVDIHLYGDPKKLHPNLRNNFINLCHHVYTHETEDMPN